MNGNFSFSLRDPAPEQLMPAPATGDALNAMAPAQVTPPPQDVGSAMESMATAYTLPGIFASGGRVTREVYDALSPVEQEFLDTLKSSTQAGQPIKAGRQLIAAFNSYAKQIQSNTPQVHQLPDGRQVTMLNGQIIPDQKQPDAIKNERWNADDGTVMLTDPTTGRTFPAWNEQTGEPMRATPKLSDGQKMRATPIQNRLDMLKGQADSLQMFGPDDKVKWNQETMEYYKPMFGGSTVEDEMNRLAKETETQQSKLNNILNPSGNAPAKSTPAPKATPSAYSSPDDVRAAVRAGKLDRAAAVQILRSQFQYK